MAVPVSIRVNRKLLFKVVFVFDRKQLLPSILLVPRSLNIRIIVVSDQYFISLRFATRKICFENFDFQCKTKNMRCCVQNCFNDDSKKTNKRQGLTFHRVPKDPDRSAAWLKAMTRLGYRSNKSLTVCSAHFLPEDFDDTRHNQRRVKSGAVPTIMAPIIQEEFKVCRVCLALDVKMYDMKNYKLSDMFQNITGILAIDNKGSILQQVCWECTARLSAAAAFRDKAQLSDALLKDLVHINKSDIATLKQKHTSLKSHLTVHSMFTSSDIDDETDVKARETEIRINEEEYETEFEENEPWIETPMKTEKESDPLADDNDANEILIQDVKSDTFSEVTDDSDDSSTSVEEDSKDGIRNNKVKINNNNKILTENTQNKIPRIKSKGKILLADDKKQKPKLVDEEESSGADDSQSTAEVTMSKPKRKKRSKVGAPNEEATIRNYKISDRLKEKIIAMKANGVPVSVIAKETGLTIPSIVCWWRLYRKNGCTYRRSITPGRNQSDEQNNQSNPAEPGKEMGACSEIVRQRLHKAGLEYILMKKPEENVNLGQEISKYRAQLGDLKWRIITLKQKGLSTSEVAYLLDTSRNTVSKWWYRWCDEGHIQDHKRTGRKRKTTAEEDQLMIERVMREQSVHTASVAMEFRLSAGTLRRRLKGAGFKPMERKAYVPLKAGRTHKVDEERKQKIISMKRKGVSVTYMANQYRVPRTTIHQWWRRWREENNNLKISSDNTTSTSTEQEQNCTEGANVETSLQTPAIMSSNKSIWKKMPDVGCVS